MREAGWEPMWDALISERGFIPAPVIVELHRVTGDAANNQHPNVVVLLDAVASCRISVTPFDDVMAQAAAAANPLYGSGNGRGGKLNMLDLMVYGTAKARALPILCTGQDFAATDALIHSASRTG